MNATPWNPIKLAIRITGHARTLADATFYPRIATLTRAQAAAHLHAVKRLSEVLSEWEERKDYRAQSSMFSRYATQDGNPDDWSIDAAMAEAWLDYRPSGH